MSRDTPTPGGVATRGASARLAAFAWILLPFSIYLFLVLRLAGEALTWDDYGILTTLLQMMDATSAREWLASLVAQHNEHRIAVMRLAALAVTSVVGHVDFRVLAIIGNLEFLGVFLLFWAEFRDRVAAPLFAAAAFLMFQLSYYEASVWASGGLLNMGVIFFSFACLFFATRGRWPAVLACILCGIFAVGLSANGLLALPLAAAICALQGRRGRAVLFAAIAAVLFFLYFRDYVRPPNYPSMLAALVNPVGAAKFFLIVIGGIVPGHWEPIAVGLLVLLALGFLARRGVWKTHPTVAVWVVFVLVSAAAATAGRVGFGVFHASRYALYSTCLVVLAFLAACELARPSGSRTIALTIIGAACVSFAVSWWSWKDARKFSINGHLLAKPVSSSSEPPPEPYFGMYFPNRGVATQLLGDAERRGLYFPKPRTIHPATVKPITSVPASARLAGYLDEVSVDGSRVVATGWSDIPATIPGRAFGVYPARGIPRAKAVPTDRSDVARVMLDPRFVFSGFRLELEFESTEAAKEAAASMCIVVEAPGHPATVLGRSAPASCPPVATAKQ